MRSRIGRVDVFWKYPKKSGGVMKLWMLYGSRQKVDKGKES
jgi:hypothetical protein